MIEAFRQWFESRRSKLAQTGISLYMPPATKELSSNSIYADLRSERYEWTAQLWKNGLSDFHFLDWADMDRGVITTHYEFQNEEELYSALEAMLQRMQGEQENS